MQTGIIISNDTKALTELSEQLIRILEIKADQATIQKAMDVLLKVAEPMRNITISDCTIGDHHYKQNELVDDDCSELTEEQTNEI